MRTRASIAMLSAIAAAATGIAGCGSSGYSAGGGGSGGGGGAETSSGGGGASSGGGASGGGGASSGGGAYSYRGAYSSGKAASSSGASSSGGGAQAVASMSGARTTVIAKSEKGFGTILAAGPKKLTLYLFEADKNGKSACTSVSCTKAWPPLTTRNAPRAGSGVSKSALGTISRGKGVKQVTYHGHPLYYYAADSNAGNAFGEGINSFGGLWYVVSTSGQAVKKG